MNCSRLPTKKDFNKTLLGNYLHDFLGLQAGIHIMEFRSATDRKKYKIDLWMGGDLNWYYKIFEEIKDNHGQR